MYRKWLPSNRGGTKTLITMTTAEECFKKKLLLHFDVRGGNNQPVFEAGVSLIASGTL